MKIAPLAARFFCLCLLTSACATAAGEKEIKNKLEFIKERQTASDSATKDRLLEISVKQKTLAEIIEITLKNEADIKHDLGRLHTVIENFSARDEEKEYEEGTISANIKTLDKKIEQLQIMIMEGNMIQSRNVESFRSEVDETYAALYAEMGKVMELLTRKKPGKKKIIRKTSAGKVKPVTGRIAAEELYDKAYKNFLSGNYGQSAAFFGEYVKRHPDTDLSDNAQYWLGESLANQGKIKEALNVYIAVAAKYPDSTKAPVSLWRAATLQEKLGRKKTAHKTLIKIRDKYPASSEYALAQKKLKSSK
ncbi:MAG: hypothetical protein IEMM0002_0394 [bacterium]|nr:MAG: hypothetical protein IEMM0002_0394 [bacterium]